MQTKLNFVGGMSLIVRLYGNNTSHNRKVRISCIMQMLW